MLQKEVGLQINLIQTMTIPMIGKGDLGDTMDTEDELDERDHQVHQDHRDLRAQLLLSLPQEWEICPCSTSRLPQ